MFIAWRHASRLLVVLGRPTARLLGCLAVRPPGCPARLGLARLGLARLGLARPPPSTRSTILEFATPDLNQRPQKLMLDPESCVTLCVPHKFQGPAHEFRGSRFKSRVANLGESKLALGKGKREIWFLI